MGGPKQSIRSTEPASFDGEEPQGVKARQQTIQQKPGRSSQLLSFLVGKRQTILLSIVAFMIIVEIIELFLAIDLGEKFHLFYDGFIFFILIPIGTWFLLKLLKKMDIEREQAQASRDLHTEFSQKLGDARSWEELVQQIIVYPHRVAPQAEVTLYVFNPIEQRLQPEVSCNRAGQLTLKPANNTNSNSLPVGSLPQLLLQPDDITSPEQITLAEALWLRSAHGDPLPLPPHRYDLPITHNDQQIGVIKLEFEPGTAPSADQIRALKAAAPIMALALEGALLQKVSAEQAAASQAQRQEIAKNLHDTLAQNVGYLRLKLDQLTGENAIREIGVVLQELERMRATADEAYQQVRDTLDELNPTQAENLVATISKQARSISQRAGFRLRLSQVGAAHNLSATTRQQILYIVREALYNVEKHAHASQVHLQFLWLECELIIKITDDGIGFNPLIVPNEGHYGLWIMEQRAQEINGTLKIGPATDENGDPQGTEVTVWVPCPSSKAPEENFPAGSLVKPKVPASAVRETPKKVP